MQGALHHPGLITGPSVTLFACLSLFILALGLAFCWYQWKLIRLYQHFPTQRLESKWLLPIITENFPKNVPFTSVVFQELISEVKRFQTEGLCVLWFFRPYLFIYSEEFIKMLFNENAVADKASLYVVMKEIFGNGLLGSDEETWKSQRKLLNPAFYLGVLKGKMPIFNANAVYLVEKLRSFEDKPTEKLLDILKYCTFNIMSESILGLKMSDEKNGSKVVRFMTNFDNATQFSVYRAVHPWLQWKFLLPLFHSGRKYLKEVVEIHSFTNEVIEELKKSVTVCGEMEENFNIELEVKKSFAQILIEQHLKDPTFTTDEVRDHLATFLAAGHDTTSCTLMWCFYSLGQHPEIQERVYKEIESVVEGKDVTFDDLGKLKYLNCVIKETLRLYCTVPIYGRKAKREIQCGQYKIPKGTEIVFFSFMLHRNPDVYPEPEKFDPERFSENSEIRPWMHIPFAEGYRNCIGKKFSTMEMKVLLVHVLRHFKITSVNKITDKDLDWTIILKPINPIRMLFTTRESQY